MIAKICAQVLTNEPRGTQYSYLGAGFIAVPGWWLGSPQLLVWDTMTHPATPGQYVFLFGSSPAAIDTGCVAACDAMGVDCGPTKQVVVSTAEATDRVRPKGPILVILAIVTAAIAVMSEAGATAALAAVMVAVPAFGDLEIQFLDAVADAMIVDTKIGGDTPDALTASEKFSDASVLTMTRHVLVLQAAGGVYHVRGALLPDQRSRTYAPAWLSLLFQQ